MRRFLIGLALFLAVITCGHVAYADGIQQPWNTIIYGPLKSGGLFGSPVYTEVGVCAWGRSAAAMVALGYSGSTIDGLSAEAKAKLSNQSTGGRFWLFAQNFNLPDEDDWSIAGITWRSMVATYGEGNVWRGYYQDDDMAGAKADADTIIAGGSIGGGGSGGTMPDISGDYVTISMHPFEATNGSNVVYALKDDSLKFYTTTLGNNPAGIYPISVKKSYYNSLVNLAKQGYKVIFIAGLYNSYYESISFDWIAYPSDSQITKATRQVGSDDAAVNAFIGYDVTYSGTAYKNAYVQERRYMTTNNHWPASVDGLYNAFQSQNWDYSRSSNVSESYKTLRGSAFCWINEDGSQSGGGNDTLVPPSNWPDPPTVNPPTSPTVPEPDPPTTDPRPVEPVTPTLPFFPIESTYPDVSYDTADLEAVLDALNDHCQHLQSAIYQGFADYYDTFTPWLSQELATLRACIRGESEWQITALNSQFDDLQDYLWQLFQWLADKMDFTFTDSAYDDSSLVWWLKRIYYKLQSSPVNTRPFDPVSDSDGAWDWLGKFIADLLARLSEGAGDLASRLLGLFDDIKDKFPFSIPWDMAAVLVLFDVPAQTPAFTVQFEVFGTPVVFEIDLHFMDEYAETIRAMESILFCFYLLFKTQWLTGVFDDLGGYLGGKLGYREG